MSLFLSPDDLRELTDLSQPAAIRRWLSEQGYTFETAASGWPKVLRTALEARLGAQAKDTARPRVRLPR